MKSSSLIKGVGIGLVAGSVLTAAAIIPQGGKRAKSKTNRLLRTVGQVVEGVSDALS